MATNTRVSSLDWRRVGAWSGSFAAHAAVLILVALPMTVPPRHPRAEPILARWIETEPPPPALSEPPPPVAPPHVRRDPAPTPPVVPAPPVHDTDMPVPVASDSTPPDIPANPLPSSARDDIGTGATRTLAYASPVRPRYPIASMRAHEQGTVLLRVLVDTEGVPQQIEIQRSSGHARLDAAARDAVEHARFRPLMRNGAAVSAWGLVPIAFRLDNG